MSDLGKAGGKAAAPTKQPMEDGSPRKGVDEPAKNRQMEFEPLHGFGGTNPGAH